MSQTPDTGRILAALKAAGLTVTGTQPGRYPVLIVREGA